jgi:glycosyltransferase involved in cell wall biosynthesis
MGGYDFSAFVIRPPVSGEISVYSSSAIDVTYGSRSNFTALSRLYKYARHHRNHIFNAFNIGPLFLLTMRLAGVKKLVYSIHGTKYWKVKWKRFFIKVLWRLALKLDYKIISNSEFSKQTFHDQVNSKASIQVLYNPIDCHRFTPPEQRYSNQILRIIYVGRLNKGKNLNRWIELAVMLHGVYKDARFAIYGDGPLYSSLDKQIKSLTANSYVCLKSFRPDIENIYRNADLLLFLSEYESFGNVVVESILCGTPVIASDTPSMREIFRDFPDFIVKVDNNLTDNVIQMLKEKDKLKELALKARDQFLTRFSVETHITALDRIYKSFND